MDRVPSNFVPGLFPFSPFNKVQLSECRYCSQDGVYVAGGHCGQIAADIWPSEGDLWTTGWVLTCDSLRETGKGQSCGARSRGRGGGVTHSGFGYPLQNGLPELWL